MNSNATNSTPNYGLPLFVASDKPAWLVDWNNTMTELDTKLKEISDAGDNTALIATVEALQTSLTALSNSFDALAEEVDDPSTGLITLVTNIQNSIDTMQADLIAQNGLIQNLDQRVTALENA